MAKPKVGCPKCGNPKQRHSRTCRPCYDSEKTGRQSCCHCSALSVARGLCAKHYWRFRKYGDPLATLRLQWKTEATQTVRGGYRYLYRPLHPNADSTGFVPEHRLVIATLVGRALRRDESVHHRNGVRDDNRKENLELWASSQPAGQRVLDLLAWADEILQRYGRLRGPLSVENLRLAV